MDLILKLSDIIGKTIKAVSTNDGVAIRFDDDSYIRLECKTEYSGGFGGYEHNSVRVNTEDLGDTDYDSVLLGYITESFYKNACSVEEADLDRRQKEYNDRVRLENENREKKLLESLKNKYE